MIDIFLNSVRLLLRGRLFRDPRRVLVQWLKGFALTLAVLLAVGFYFGPLAGTACAALAGGLLQPWLFRNLKYR